MSFTEFSTILILLFAPNVAFYFSNFIFLSVLSWALPDYNSPYIVLLLFLPSSWANQLGLLFLKSDCFIKFFRPVQFSHGFFVTWYSLFLFSQISYLQRDCGRKKQGCVWDQKIVPLAHKKLFMTVFCACLCERQRECVWEKVRKWWLAITSCLIKRVLPAKMVYLCASSIVLPFLLVHVAKQSKEALTAFLCIPIPL